MSFRRVQKDIIFFDQKATAGTSTQVLDVSDFRNCVIQVLGTASFSGSVFIMGAIGTTKPTFGWGLDNHDNPFTYVQVVNLRDGSTVDGSDGIEIRGSSLLQSYEVNINALDWIGVLLTTPKAGAVSVKATITTNA